LKGVVSRTHWNTLLQKTPPELGSKAKAQEDDLPTEETGQGCSGAGALLASLRPLGFCSSITRVFHTRHRQAETPFSGFFQKKTPQSHHPQELGQ